jgi:hypothetical protein
MMAWVNSFRDDLTRFLTLVFPSNFPLGPLVRLEKFAEIFAENTDES